jgi:hypothetical protein
MRSSDNDNIPIGITTKSNLSKDDLMRLLKAKEDEEKIHKILMREETEQKNRKIPFSMIILSLIIFGLLGVISYMAFFNEPAKAPVTEVKFDAQGLPFVAVYKDVPIWLNPFFAVAVVLALLAISLGIYLWFRISMRNRTNVIIHMPDGTREFHSYKKFVGHVFKIKGHEKDKDGQEIFYNYRFRSECLETGYFGRYIEYDYGMLEPLNRNERHYDRKDMPEIFKFISSLLNTQLAVDLLLSQKFKEFVKMMLIIILVVGFIGLILSGYIAYAVNTDAKRVVMCQLVDNNATRSLIGSIIQ